MLAVKSVNVAAPSSRFNPRTKDIGTFVGPGVAHYVGPRLTKRRKITRFKHHAVRHKKHPKRYANFPPEHNRCEGGGGAERADGAQ